MAARKKQTPRKKQEPQSPQAAAEQAERDQIAPSGVKPVEVPATDAEGTQPDVVQTTVGDKDRNRDEKALATVREVWSERNEAAYYLNRTNIETTVEGYDGNGEIRLSTSDGRLHIELDGAPEFDHQGVTVLRRFLEAAFQAV